MKRQKLLYIYLRIIFLIPILLLENPLDADKLKLKSGEIRIGKAISVSATHVEWLELNKTKRIPLSEVEGVEVGYDGLQVCAEYGKLSEINCDIILHRLTKNTASFTSKASPLKLDVVPLSKVTSLKLTFSKAFDASLFLSTGISGIWEVGSFKGKASLKSIKNGKWEIQPEGKGKSSFIVLSEELISFELITKTSVTSLIVESSPLLLPGYAQVKDKKYAKAIFLFSGALMSAGGMVYEHNQSVAAVNNNQEYIPTPDGRVFLVSNVLSTERYDFHNQRFKIYAGVFSAIIAYSLFDSFYLGQVESSTGKTSSVWIRPNISLAPIMTAKSQAIQNGNNPFQYFLEIETRF